MSNLQFPLMYERPGPLVHWPPFDDLYQRGVRLFHVDATPTEDIYHQGLRAWISPETFDYSAQEAGWQQLLEHCPEARMVLRLYIASPPWWDESHPEELQRYADGRTEHTFLHTNRKTWPSLASTRWHEDAARAMRQFLNWLDESGWSEKVTGLFLCYGITWEWGILGSDDWVDYSRPMLAYFRDWLRRAYRTDAQLRLAWGNDAVTLDTTEIPSPQQRLSSDGDLRLFPRDRAAFDFQRCLSDVNVDYLLLLARTVREATDHKYQLGTFYGFTLTARSHDDFVTRVGAGGLQGGHHALKRMEDSRLFDYTASPYAYVNRDLGEGLLIGHYPLASIQKNGLHGYEENDLWMYTNRPATYQPNSRGLSETVESSILSQRWALTQALCHGTSYWWTDLTDSRKLGVEVTNYSDPEILAEIERHHALFESIRRQDIGNSTAQIALIIDEASKDALGLNSNLFLHEVYEALPKWAWCGAPFDVWLASDIDEECMRPYKLAYCFAPYLAPADRTRLHKVLCAGGRTVWWGPYSGWSTEHGPDDQIFTELTGQPSPVPVPAALQQKEFPDWASLYGSCAEKSSHELATICRAAGVHLYGEAPLQVMARERLIGVHARDAGDYELRFPADRWRELFSDEVVAVENGVARVKLGKFDVRLYLRES